MYLEPESLLWEEVRVDGSVTKLRTFHRQKNHVWVQYEVWFWKTVVHLTDFNQVIYCRWLSQIEINKNYFFPKILRLKMCHSKTIKGLRVFQLHWQCSCQFYPNEVKYSPSMQTNNKQAHMVSPPKSNANPARLSNNSIMLPQK